MGANRPRLYETAACADEGIGERIRVEASAEASHQGHDCGQSSLPFRPRRVKTYGRTKTQPEHLAVTARHRQLAASLGLPGRVDEGRAVVRRLLGLVPDFTIARARGHIEFDMRTLPAEPPRH